MSVITINGAQFQHRRSAVPRGENDNGAKRKRKRPSVPVDHHIIPFDFAQNHISWEKEGWRWMDPTRVNVIKGALDFRPCSLHLPLESQDGLPVRDRSKEHNSCCPGIHA
jgi:hypothetical protein